MQSAIPPVPLPAPADETHQDRVLLLTDIVDSTKVFTALGEVAAAALWAEHDAASRALMRDCAALELERGDGFLLLFGHMDDAATFAQGYHALLARLSTPLTSRIGIHRGPVRIRANAEVHVAAGARALDLDGQAKAITARIQSLAQARQTLASAAAVAGLAPGRMARCSHGHWQLKGVPEPMELFEIGPDAAAFAPPPDADKAWRVVRQGADADALWLPARQVPHSLPAERDRFVGRRDHLNTLAQALQEARLVSLLGTGGTGKTRLALRHGWSRLGDHPGGVWFCDLSAATTPDGIVHATAQGLQLPLGATDPVQQVGDAIAGRGECLVILDNFEQVARHAEATLGRWLARAPAARFLVTTREVLGIVGEQALALPPLDAPEGEALLRERAAAAGAPPFSRADDAAVAPLVQLLDGLPLAIELAASRMRVMGPAALLPRMNERFQLLVARSGRHDRQATLKATLDWSWDLLTEPERSALAQLSVFEGGFTLEAAQAVVDLSEFADDPDDWELHSSMWVVDVVQALVDKSLVRRVGERRFDLLRSVLEYAAHRLPSSGDGGRTGEAHARHIRFFGAIGGRDLDRDGKIDLDNIVAACRRAMDLDMPRHVFPLLDAAWSVLSRVGPASAALPLAERAVERIRADDDQRSDVHRILGAIYYRLGRATAALEAMEKGLQLALKDSRPDRSVRLRCAISEPLMRSGRREAARQHLDQALAAAETLTDREVLHVLHNSRGHYFLECGDFDAALRSYDLALAHATAIGQKRLQAGVLGNIGAVRYSKGRPDDAVQPLEQALAVIEQLGDLQWEGNTRSNLGLALVDLGRSTEALVHFGVALRISRHLGSRRQESVILCNQGIAWVALGEFEVAARQFTACTDLAGAIGDKALLAESSLRAGAASLSMASNVAAQSGIAVARSTYGEMGDLSGQLLADSVEAMRLRHAGLSQRADELMREATGTWTERLHRPAEDLCRQLQGLGIRDALT